MNIVNGGQRLGCTWPPSHLLNELHNQFNFSDGRVKSCDFYRGIFPHNVWVTFRIYMGSSYTWSTVLKNCEPAFNMCLLILKHGWISRAYCFPTWKINLNLESQLFLILSQLSTLQVFHCFCQHFYKAILSIVFITQRHHFTYSNVVLRTLYFQELPGVDVKFTMYLWELPWNWQVFFLVLWHQFKNSQVGKPVG